MKIAIIFALIAFVAVASAIPAPGPVPAPAAPVKQEKREVNAEDDLREGDEEKDLKGAESAYHHGIYGGHYGHYPYGYPSYYYSSVYHHSPYYSYGAYRPYSSYWW